MLRKIDLSAIPQDVLLVASAIRRNAGRAYLVGGPVRDLILGRPPQDWDIATDLTPQAVLRVFPSALTVGIEFGRVQVGEVDVVSLRGESDYLDKRHPSTVAFGVSIEEDLRRRDFTINAMAAEFDDLLVIDPLGGIADLGSRTLRAVGDPRDRLTEDPLRILRAVRFKTVLGMNLDPSVSAVLPGLAGLLAGVSGERVFAEIRRLLVAPGVYQGILDLRDYGIGAVILPEAFAAGAEVVETAARALSMSCPDLPTRLALLLWSSGVTDMAKQALRRLNVDARVTRDVLWLLRNAGSEGSGVHAALSEDRDFAYMARRLMDSEGAEQVYRLMDCEQALWRAERNPGLPPRASALAAGLLEVGDRPIGPLALTGDDVMRIVATEGPRVGDALAYLKDLVLRDPSMNTKDVLENALREWWKRR